ncbi:MAG: SDR family NAD(P)-dependent oxidoreductase [Clostridia bacterium]
MKLSNKVIVVTGGSSGLGEEIAKRFIDDGNVVWILSRTEGETHFENFIACDVTDKEQVFSAFKKVYETSGSIDVMIANAGVGISGALELMDTDAAKKVFDVNFWGVLNCYQAVVPYMKKGSKIINISSACALFALPYRAMYCASKSAVNVLTFGERMELSESGIQCCAVCPGDIKTPFTKNRIKLFETNERYGDRIKKSAEFIDQRQDKRMPAQFVAQRIVNLASKKHLKPMVIISGLYKFLFFMQRIAPVRLFIYLTNKLFNKK